LVLAGLFIAAYLVIVWELRERRQLTARIERDANHDSLTQLPNRRFFERWLAYTLAQARRNGAHVALLFIDLDGFKAVNDRYGHKAGDSLLAEVAHRFRRIVRGSDLLVRLGGDEFALIAPNARDGRELAQLAQRLLSALADPSEPPLTDPPLGASIGVAFFPEDALDLSGLIAAADEAMYTAKRAGRNRIAFYATAVATSDSTARRAGGVGSKLVASSERSQVNWRFASWRVAAIPRARSADSSSSPSRYDHACR
jgi:diguanylate cyclase (GGDEF)-like protein